MTARFCPFVLPMVLSTPLNRRQPRLRTTGGERRPVRHVGRLELGRFNLHYLPAKLEGISNFRLGGCLGPLRPWGSCPQEQEGGKPPPSPTTSPRPLTKRDRSGKGVAIGHIDNRIDCLPSLFNSRALPTRKWASSCR